MQEDFHFLRLCRYVEANPLRAGLVPRAEDWPWSGLRARSERGKPFRLATWPVDRPRNWLAAVNEEQAEDDLKPLRLSVNRGRPWGEEDWVRTIARRLGLVSTLRNPGRPRKD